jgi:hypothetical protein
LNRLSKLCEEKRFISAETKLEAMSQEFNKERSARHLLVRTNSNRKHVDARNTERACASLDKLNISTDRAAKLEVEKKARYTRDIEDVETTLACSRF